MRLRTDLGDRRTAIYVRTLADDGRDVERLLVKLRKFCARRAWRDPVEYVDRQSRFTSRPREFCRMFGDARRRKIDLIVFWGLNQLSCDGAAVTLNYLHQLTQHGCGWFDAKDELSNFGVRGKEIRQLLANLSSQNSVRKANRIKQRAPEDRIGRGRPSLKFDLEKARRLRKDGAPLWYIREEVGCFNLSESTLCRKLRGVKKEETKPSSHWAARFRTLHPDGWNPWKQRSRD